MSINNISGSLPIQPNIIQDANKVLEKSNIDFSKLLIDALDSVNTQQALSERASNQFLLGEIDSIHDVRIAGMKAELSLNLAVEVTNKVLSAYNEIMRLQL